MSKIRKLTFLLLCCTLLISLTGCGNRSEEKQWGASCSITVDGLPAELESLPQTLRENLYFSLSLSGTSNDKHYSVQLTERNGFTAQLYMLPGSYSVSHVYVRTDGNLPIQATAQAESIVLTKDTDTPLTISISNGQELISYIQQSAPTEEILTSENFSRKIQYAGTVMDLNALGQQMHFSTTETSPLRPGKVGTLVSDSDKSVHMLVKNTTDTSIPIQQATCIGFSFSGCNAILPQGISVGSTVESIAHAETGILKTPNYCHGSPLIGMDIDSAELVYIDPESGDRITCHMNPADDFISWFSYEFEQYQ